MCIAADVCGNRDTCIYMITVICLPVQCACPSNIPPFTITQGQDRIDVSCGQTAMLDCPVTDLFINGMIKCQSSHPVIPCPPNSVTWTLDRPGLFDLNGTSSSSVSLLFNASTVSDPGIYTLTFSTICPDSPEPCICIISWFQPDCDPNAFCQGNIVQNGDFEIGDPVGNFDDINIATGWSGIWPTTTSLETGEFLNQSSVLAIGLTQPLPASQGNYAGFWLDYSSDNSKREGIMNALITPIPQNSGCYSLEFKLACLGQQYQSPVLEIFGVPVGAIASTPTLFNQTTPPNASLFIPAAISLGNITVNTATCTNNFTTVNIDFNSSILPVVGINRLFFTRQDAVFGQPSRGAYIAMDDVCLSSSPCDIVCTCPPSSSIFTIKEGNNVYSTTCSSPTTLQPTLDCPVNDLTISGNYGCVSSDPNIPCPPSEIKWTLDRPVGTDLTGVTTGPNLSISFPAASVASPGIYTLTITTVCGTNNCVCVLTWRQQECESLCSCPANNTIFTIKEGNSTYSVSCNSPNNTPPVLDCPVNDLNILGNYGCVSSNPGIPCPPSEIKWKLDRPVGADLTGVTTGPNLNISFPAASVTSPGIYTLTITTLCGGQSCECVLTWMQRPCTGNCCSLYSTSPAINPYGLSGGKSFFGMDFIDVNGDTYMDHIYSNSSQLLYRLNPGNGSNFGNEFVLTSNLREPYNCDYDNDGKEDIFGIRLTSSLPSLGFIKNLGGGSFSSFNSILTLSNVRFAVGDVGQDGVVDLVTVNSAPSSQIMYYEGIPGTNPSFKSGVPWFTTNISNTFSAEFPIPELYDIDCDGDLDLFLGLSGEIRSFTNNGGMIAANILPNFSTVAFTTQTYNQPGGSEFITPRYVSIDSDFFTEFIIDYNNAQQLLYFDCIASAVDETALLAESFKVFPNPTNNMVTLKYTGDHPVTANLDILNLWGQKVQTINKVNLHEDYTLDMSHLRAGMYLLRIATKHNNHIFLKIIKTE